MAAISFPKLRSAAICAAACSLAAAVLAVPCLAFSPSAPAPQAGTSQDELPAELEKARKLYVQLEDEEALAVVNEYLLRNRDDVYANYLRALCLRNLLRFRVLAEDLASLSDRPLNMELLYLEARGLLGEEERKAAMVAVDELLLDDPELLPPRVTRAKLLMRSGRLAEALSELQTVRRADPKMAEPVLLLAQLMEHSGKFQEASGMFYSLVGNTQRYSGFDPHIQLDAVKGLARVNVQLGRFEDGIELYNQLLERDPDNAGYRFMLGLCHGMRNRFEDAIANMTQAIELAPDVLEYRSRLADIYRSQKMYDEAVEHYIKVMELGPEKALAALRLGECYLELGKLDRAATNIDLALQLAPESADVLEISARIRERMGDTEKARAQYRAAWTRSPLKFESMYRLGLLLAASEDEDEQQEGRDFLERYRQVEQLLPDIIRVKSEADLSPRRADLQWRMGGLLNIAGEYEVAVRYAQRSLALEPNFVPAIALLGMIAANTGRDEEALRAFERAQELLTNHPNPSMKPDPEIAGYIEKLKAGEPLSLPLGRLIRSQKEEEEGAGGGDGGGMP